MKLCMNMNLDFTIDFVEPPRKGIAHSIYGTYHLLNDSKPAEAIEDKGQEPTTASSSNKCEQKNIPALDIHQQWLDAIHRQDLSKLKEIIHHEIGISQNNTTFLSRILIPETQTTILHLLSQQGWLEGIEAIRDHLDEYVVNLKDRENETCLLKACTVGAAQVVSILIDASANVLDTDCQGWTALHNACSSGSYETVLTILESNSSPAYLNQKNNQGFTCLMNAASRGFRMVCDKLMMSGADPTLQNSYNETAYDLASQNGHYSLADSLHSQTGDLAQTAIDYILEWERSSSTYFPSQLFLQIPENMDFSDAYLSTHDPPHFSTSSFSACKMSEVTLPKKPEGSQHGTWYWVNEWELDTTHLLLKDDDGWLYGAEKKGPFFATLKDCAEHLQNAHSTSLLGRIGFVSYPSSWIRYRRWARVRRRQMNFDSSSTSPTTSPNENTHVLQRLNDELNSIKLKLDELFDASRQESDEVKRATLRTQIQSLLDKADEIQAAISALNDQESREVELSKSIVGKIESIPPKTMPTFTSLTGYWQPDHEAPECSDCERSFAIWLRRHHCRRCGYVFCANCSPHRVILSSNLNGPQRVCNSCYDILMGPDTVLSPEQVSASLAHRFTSLLPTSSTSFSQPHSNYLTEDEEILSSCPVCNKNLRNLNEVDIEQHVNTCFERLSNSGAGESVDSDSVNGDAPSVTRLRAQSFLHPTGARYVVQTLQDGDKLTGLECSICFEEFEVAQRVARLICLCVFHEKCITSWFATSAGGSLTGPRHSMNPELRSIQSCPLHSRIGET